MQLLSTIPSKSIFCFNDSVIFLFVKIFRYGFANGA